MDDSYDQGGPHPQPLQHMQQVPAHSHSQAFDFDANHAFDCPVIWPSNAVMHEPLPQQMVQQVGLEALHYPSACPPAMGHSTHNGAELAEPMGDYSPLQVPLPMHSIPGGF